MRENKILVIGSSNMDQVVSLQHLPASGETVIATSLAVIPGGKGANQAYACAKLGGKVTFLTVLGGDSFGSAIKENLRHAGVDTEHIATINNLPTGVAFVYVDSKGNNSIAVIQGANEECNGSYLESKKDIIMSYDFLLAQLEIPHDGVFNAIKLAKCVGKTTVLNPAPAPEFIPDEVLAATDFITPNETELALLTQMQITSEQDVILAIDKLLKRGVKNVLVTLGSKGALLGNKDGFTGFPVPAAEVIDTTAAGDVFSGAFVTALSKNNSVHESIIFANAAAAISVTRKGAQSSVPSYHETLELLDKIPSGIIFKRGEEF